MTPETIADRVRRQLTDIPDLMVEVALYLTTGSLPPDPDARHGTNNPARIPIVAAVTDLLDVRSKRFSDEDEGVRDLELDRKAGSRRLGVLPTLGLWVSMVHAELEDLGTPARECCPPRQHTVAGEVGWLMEQLDRVLELHNDFAEDVDWLWTDLRKACRLRPPLPLTCATCGFALEGMDSDAWFRCTGCPRTWRMDAELRRLGATQPGMPLSQVSRLLEVPVKTLHDWKSRGWILPVGKRGATFLFEVEKVQQVRDNMARGRPRGEAG